MIILSLIVKRCQIKAVVKDKRAAMEAFGTYVEVGGVNLDFSKITSEGPCYFNTNSHVLFYAVNGRRCK